MSLRVSTRPRHRNSPRPAEKSAPGFLQWIRSRACCANDFACAGKIEAAHVDYAGGKGIGSKVADRFAIPLCTEHHRQQHRMGWASFEHAAWNQNGYALGAAEAYWRAWPGRAKWERKLANG